MPKKNITTEEKKETKEISAKGATPTGGLGSAFGGKKSTSVLIEEEAVKKEETVKRVKQEDRQITEATAFLSNLRITPRKTKLVADFVKGLAAEEAILRLTLLNKASSLPIKKLIQSALANAKNNFKLKAEDLIVKNVIIGQGRTLKRFKPAAFGTGHALLKRSSNVTVILAVKAAEKKKSKNFKKS